MFKKSAVVIWRFYCELTQCNNNTIKSIIISALLSLLSARYYRPFTAQWAISKESCDAVMDKNRGHSLVKRTIYVFLHMHHYTFNVPFFPQNYKGNTTGMFEVCTHNKNISWETSIGRFAEGAPVWTPPLTHQSLRRYPIHRAIIGRYMSSDSIFLIFFC